MKLLKKLQRYIIYISRTKILDLKSSAILLKGYAYILTGYLENKEFFYNISDIRVTRRK